ncbi:hypothetical protein PC116_g8150 [Phytophthora cactorum]|uniref:Uncharacterized protein n=1 Tax=Phytophthora cactorum TaxID=29920 RepID=A0A8T1DF42_9STRA|nr:hypothetical protein PC112_g5539 [Phytophthora cactorum]KAG2839222.1 hypothetical protein PC111_g3944 [Phytophthora cactorum]KAG2863613.1 hypothetical protein PC113_g5297 [Phytophthora cactorum]KAG2927184.1 hypothetical protein PC114_g3552 [Phytophthora cactorum]KAG2938730.1 hypothetical protein PC115_g3600 [Phytophthora cactorum]
MSFARTAYASVVTSATNAAQINLSLYFSNTAIFRLVGWSIDGCVAAAAAVGATMPTTCSTAGGFQRLMKPFEGSNGDPVGHLQCL